MKRLNNIYSRIASRENVTQAFYKCIKGKSKYKEVQIMLQNPQYYIDAVVKMLQEKTYVSNGYKTHYVYEPKKRLIYVAPIFPDRIIHHCILNVLEPYWKKQLSAHTYSCIKERGTHAAHREIANKIKHYNWILQIDVKKFYPSINHNILKNILRRKIKCRDTLQLLDIIIDSIESETNVPIGNYTSQWFGNIYLNELDKLLEHKLKLKFVRYCDDVIIFSQSKETLKSALKTIREFLKTELALNLSKARIINARQGIKAIGYRSFRKNNGNIQTLLKKETARKIKSFVLSLTETNENIEKTTSQLASYNGILKFCKPKRFNNNIDFDVKFNKYKQLQKEAVKQCPC